MDELLPVLITWHFNPSNGKLELDCFLECDDPKHAPAVKHVYLRAGVHQSTVSLLHIPKDCGREYVETWMKEADQKDVVELLTKAKVQQSDIVREKHKGGNVIDFLMKD